MYYEEKVISGVLHYRYAESEEFKPYTVESLTAMYIVQKTRADKYSKALDIIEYKTIEAIKNINN